MHYLAILFMFVCPALSCPALGSSLEEILPCVALVSHPRTGRADVVGTAVSIDSRGYLLTAAHVVGERKQIAVTLVGKTYQARVVAVDAAADLALLHVATGKPVPTIRLASGEPRVGQAILAIGHPYGYERTVSRGIISALGRKITTPTGTELTGLLQTDAAINPGNSGGPLVNEKGEMVGLVVALRERAQGIAFAVNVRAIRRMIDRYLTSTCSKKPMTEDVLMTTLLPLVLILADVRNLHDESFLYLLTQRQAEQLASKSWSRWYRGASGLGAAWIDAKAGRFYKNASWFGQGSSWEEAFRDASSRGYPHFGDEVWEENLGDAECIKYHRWNGRD